MSAQMELAATITGTWPLGPTTIVWTDTLAAKFHDLDLAWDTYRQLRDTHHGRDMTIPQFADAYRRQRNTRARDNAERDARHDAAHCQRGDGCDGWRSITHTHNGHEYRAVEPCSCLTGRRNQPLHTATLEHNAAELDRILGADRHHHLEQQEAS